MLALIPLDDRPCNLRFPAQIAAIGGDELVSPPIETLGHFNTPGQPGKIAAWLRDLPEVAALIVSCDMLAYGGLVASRRSETDEETALSRLEALRAFREARPTTPIYGFNILMRLTVTMDSEEAAANYYNIQRYARLIDEAERFDSDYLREQLETVKAAIPPAALEEYLRARQRNHGVNLRMIEWLSEGTFDYLLITQEDATEFGLHRREQAALLARAIELGVAEKMSLHPGADEAALTLLARQWNLSPRFRVHWSSRAQAKNIAAFEDRPYDVALSQHVAAIGGVLLPGEVLPQEKMDADFELFVNAPVGGSAKDEDKAARAGRSAKLGEFVRKMEEAAQNGRRVALCDVAFPNGADDLLMSKLEARGLLGKLAAFAAWNTAGNTTGTVLAQCAAIKRSAESEEDAENFNSQFTFERLVDDWLYQSRLRARLETSAHRQGLSPLNMGEAGESVETGLRRELRGYAQMMASRHFDSALEDCEISLPWRRAFEVDFRARLQPNNRTA